MSNDLPHNAQQQPQGMTLSAYNARIERLISGEAILQNQWVIAETSDLRLNRSGHCYTELIEKDANGETIAKVGAAIWASNYSQSQVC